MACYSVQPRNRIFAKGYRFLSFARNMIKTKIKNLSRKYSKKLPDHTNQSASDALKTVSKRAIQKIAEATDDYKSLNNFTTE